MRKVVLISCVKTKLPHRAKAADMYTSSLFKFNLKYARILEPDEIYILSAEYGLLRLTDEIDPYERTLNNMRLNERIAWANRVISQLRKVESLDNCEFIFLAGENYREWLILSMKHYQIPLEGLGIGKQLGRLKELTSKVRRQYK